MSAEQMKYAEVQAVAGGVTAVQGSPGSGTDAWDSMLSRNIELYNFGQDGISTCAVCGAADDDYTGSHLISQNLARSMLGSCTFPRAWTRAVRLSSMRFGIKDSLWMRPL